MKVWHINCLLQTRYLHFAPFLGATQMVSKYNAFVQHLPHNSIESNVIRDIAMLSRFYPDFSILSHGVTSGSKLYSEEMA